MRATTRKEKRPPIFLMGQNRASEELRAELLRKQGWRCATCGRVCTGDLKLLDREVVHVACYIEQLRTDLREVTG